MAAPGKVVKVAAKGDFKSIMQPNLLWPKAEIAKRLVEKALMEFTGAPNIAEALGKFIHKDDIVAIKPNGIAGQKGMTQATNFETVLPVVEGPDQARREAREHHGVRAVPHVPDGLPHQRAQLEAPRRRADGNPQQQEPPDAGRPYLPGDPDALQQDAAGCHRGDRHVHDEGPLHLRLHRVPEEHHPRQREQPATTTTRIRPAPRSRCCTTTRS